MLSEFNSLLFYIFAFSGSSYLLGFARQNQRPNTFFYKFIIFCALFIPSLIAGYRSCGTDTMRYLYDYVRYIDFSWSEIFEKIEGLGESGHLILTKFLGYLTHPRVYLMIYGAITAFLVYWATYSFKNKNAALAMLIYYFVFFVYSFNGMRQHIAIAIIVFSFKFIFEKKFVKYLITVLIACSFHTSAVLTLPLYFLWKKKSETVSWIMVFPLLAMVLLFSLNLEAILDAISEFEIESAAVQRYTTYTDVLESKNRDFYLNALVSIITLFHYPRLKKIDSKNTFFITLILIGTLLGISGFVSPYAKRISTYFYIGEIWILSDIPQCYKDHHSIWTARILVITYAIVRFTIIAYVLGQSDLIPYMWILPGWARI